MNNEGRKPRVIILGAGFGGLFAARALRGKPVDVLLIDRQNYHTFTPLLYQVATSALDPSQIAHPIRAIFSEDENIQCLMGKVTEIHPEKHQVTVEIDGKAIQEDYDFLIIATGSSPNYFGQDRFQDHTFDLRTLDDAVQLRNHILGLFEKATWAEDPQARSAMTTYIVIGGGPTGLETAGALYELYNHVLDKEFSGDKTMHASVYLIEMRPHLLDTYPPRLRQAALEQVRSLGVDVILENPVEEITPEGVTLADGRQIRSQTVIWAAGVKGASTPGPFQQARAQNGRIPVTKTLHTHGTQDIYALGDVAYLTSPEGEPYPMMIPVAMQQGILAAENILRALGGQPEKEFHYHDKGVMATIGRSRAVAWLYNRVPLRGFIAWLAWLGFHLISLIGFRNKLVVLINWIWNYLTYDRSVRIILD